MKDAKQNLKRIDKRGEEVSEIAESLKKIRQQNHFAQAMEQIILKKRGTVNDA